MSNEKIIKKRISDLLVVVMLSFHQWSGAVVFRPEDFSIGEGGNLPPEDVTASLGAKKICDPALLRNFTVLKKRAERLLEENGIPYCNGYAIPIDKSRDVLDRLDDIVDEYEDLREEFLRSYDYHVESWADSHPEFADQIRRGKKTPQEVGRSIAAGYKVVQVYPYSDKDEAYDAEAAEAAELTDTLYDSTVKAAEQLYKNSFSDQEEISTSRCLGAIRRIRDKLDGLSFLDTSVRPVIQMIDSTLNAIPDKGPYVGEPFFRLKTLVLTLADPRRIRDLTEVKKLTKKNFLEPVNGTVQASSEALFEHLDDDLQYLFEDEEDSAAVSVPIESNEQAEESKPVEKVAEVQEAMPQLAQQQEPLVKPQTIPAPGTQPSEVFKAMKVNEVPKRNVDQSPAFKVDNQPTKEEVAAAARAREALAQRLGQSLF